jgi:hypothetical protein
MNLDRLRQIVAAATSGPWVADPRDGVCSADGFTVNPEVPGSDADYCATFDPPTVAALLEVAESAEAFEATDIRVKGLVREGNATSLDVRDLGAARIQLRSALHRLREVTG